MIEICVGSKAFGGKVVLSECTLRITAGECIALQGPSGIGKSTLLRIAAGLDDDFQGHVHRSGRLAVVFQTPALLPWRTALDNVCITTGATPAAATLSLTKMGLGDKGNLYPGQLSLGQQRRLSLARALATQPDILLLDEPFTSLDNDTRGDMLKLVATCIKQCGAATLLITHDTREAQTLASRIVTLAGQPATLID